MPYKARKACNHPLCRNLIEVGQSYCDEHQSFRRSYRKPQAADSFYSSALWQHLRNWYKSQHPVCELCGRKPTEMVDHIIEIKDGGHPTAVQNLQGACRRCHQRKTVRARRERQAVNV